MTACELIIDRKTKDGPFGIVSPADFAFHPGQSVDPQIIVQRDNISLYCLDHENRRVLFVETTPGEDLLQAPFYFIAQYEHAQRLIAVPYATLHEIASATAVEASRIVLVYSTGRCGSTLFSQALNLSPEVVSFSEPDVFSQLVMLHTSGQADDDQVAALLRDSLLIMSAQAQSQGFTAFAFKFRSYVVALADLFHRSTPTARSLFLYRNARTWAYSFSRSFGVSDELLNKFILDDGFCHMIPSVHARLARCADGYRWVEHLAHMWSTCMQAGRQLRQREAPVACARFEDLKTNPVATIQRLLVDCGLPLPHPEELERVLAKDSQQGTAGAQDRKEAARQLTAADLDEVEHLITQIDPALTADFHLG